MSVLAAAAQPLEVFGIRLVGITAESGRKFLLSIALIVIVLAARRLLRFVVETVLRGQQLARVRFWVRQAFNILSAIIIAIGLISLWFDDPSRMTTALGLVTAGLAFASQKFVGALLGYLVIMRGKTFSVGDRIVMGGVRGDVIALRFTSTTIMEMGQPPPVQKDEPAMWVQSRQYTGRLVTVSNARVFDEPVYNYTQELPYIWEELTIPISYKAPRDKVEQMLLEVVQRHTADLRQMSEEDRAEIARRYRVDTGDDAPRVFYKLTDNWLELTVRFIAPTHGVRGLKDQISRDVLRGLEELDVEIASATFEIVGLPPVQLSVASPSARGAANANQARPSAAVRERG